MKTKRCEACGKVSEGRCVDIRTKACRCDPVIAQALDRLIAAHKPVAAVGAHPHCTLCGGIITLVFTQKGHSQYCGKCDRA